MEEEQRAAAASAPCSRCGHVVPEANMSLHRATCQHNEDNHRNTNSHTNSENNRNEAAATAASSSVEMSVCEECGKEIPATSKVIHDATCTQHTQRQQQEEEERIEEDYEVVETPAGQEEQMEEESSDDTMRITEPVEVTQWACPRCTLLNPVQATQCDACLYTLPTPNTNNTEQTTAASPGAIQVQVQEINPRLSSAVTSASNIASWSLFGALLGGPVGAMLGGGTAALFDGIHRVRSHSHPQQRHLQQHQQRQVFSSSSIRTSSSGTTTMSIMNNVGGRYRRVNIQSEQGFLDQLTPADQRIFQMLLLHAMGQGSLDPLQHAGGGSMTLDDLLNQFGVPPEHIRNRGATQECIDAIGLDTVDEETCGKLKESQTVCGICLEEFKVQDEMRTMDCTHCFHKECIDRWLGQVASCPICKKELKSDCASGTSPSSSSSADATGNHEGERQQQQQVNFDHDHNA